MKKGTKVLVNLSLAQASEIGIGFAFNGDLGVVTASLPNSNVVEIEGNEIVIPNRFNALTEDTK